jgi:hypothetical protein
MKAVLLLTVLLCVARVPLIAQDADAGWPVVERCVGAPTTPPADWMFEGTILMTGDYGLHAINDALDTPYVIAFNSGWLETALSPDGHWFAALEGTSQVLDGGGAMRALVNVDKLMVYSTVDVVESFELEWDYSFGYMRADRQIVWEDNTNIILERGELRFVSVNPVTQEVNDWRTEILPLGFNTSFSPDLTRVVTGISSFTETGVYDPSTGDINLLDANVLYWYRAVWMPDSSRFVVVFAQNENSEQVGLFNRDGTLENIIFNAPAPRTLDIPPRAWSSNGKQFAFSAYDVPLHIVDVEQQQIINTCQSVLTEGIAWSPDNRFLAFRPSNISRDRQQPIRILDLENNSQYTVAYHGQGSIIGWRAD